MAIYYFSDAHLGAKYISDPLKHQQTLVQMLQHMSRDAESIYMLGDIIDFWFEYKDVIPKGFVRFFAQLAKMTDQGIKIYWLHGNHDMWTRDYFKSELGITTIADTYYDVWAYDTITIITHGDTIGRVPWSYRLLRTLFRSTLCRRMLAAVHPRLTMAVAQGWSANSRKASQNTTTPDMAQYLQWARKFVNNGDMTPPIDNIVAGHMHHPFSGKIPGKIPGTCTTLTILGDCYQDFSYARQDAQGLQLLKFDPDRP